MPVFMHFSGLFCLLFELLQNLGVFGIIVTTISTDDVFFELDAFVAQFIFGIQSAVDSVVYQPNVTLFHGLILEMRLRVRAEGRD
jgi:hypothetical protein